MNFSDKIGSSKSLTEFTDTLKYSTGQLDHVASVRILKNSFNVIKNRDDAMTLKSDPNFMKVVEAFKSEFANLNEMEAGDAMFILRKASKLPLINIQNTDANVLRTRINTFVDQKSFNFRNLCNLYFNFACLGWYPEKIVKGILQSLEENPTQLSVNIVPQIIQSAAIRGQPLTQSEYKLVDIICRASDLYYTQMDYRKRTELFKNLARMDLHINTNRQMYPSILHKMRKDFKENVEKLGEEEVLSIIEAYSYFSSQFGNDLIDEFRRMVDTTLEHNPSNLQSPFLVKYLDAQVKLNR